jgi:nitroreductase
MASRQPDHEVDPLFLERWSPRAFDGSEMPEPDLLTLFEAARWAPSAFNSQPWRFLYARRGDADWERFLGLLIPWNQGWAHSASALVYILSDSLPFTDRKSGEPQPSSTHSFDAGAAWACLALQATRMRYCAPANFRAVGSRCRNSPSEADGRANSVAPAQAGAPAGERRGVFHPLGCQPSLA